jgi:hypothetical protein
MPGKGTRCLLKWGLDGPQSRSRRLEKEKKYFLKILLLSISKENSVGFCRLHPHKFAGYFLYILKDMFSNWQQRFIQLREIYIG